MTVMKLPFSMSCDEAGWQSEDLNLCKPCCVYQAKSEIQHGAKKRAF